MRFVDSTLVLLVTHSAGLVVTFLVSLMVSRVLGPAGKGTFSLLLGLATILFGISNLGMGVASQYFISRDPRSARAHFGNTLWFPFLAAVVTVSIFIATFPLWQTSLGELRVEDLLPVFAMLPLMLAFESQCQLLVVSQQIKQRSVAILTHGAVLLFAAACLLYAGANALATSYAYVLAWFIGGAMTFYFVLRVIGSPTRPSLSLFKTTMRYAGWIWLANMIRGAFLRADFLVLYAIRGPGDAGIYSVALALTSGMTVAFQAVVTVFYPKTAAKSDIDAAATTPLYFKGMLFLMTALGVITALLSYPMLSIFGRDFVRGHTAMLILIVAIGVSGLNSALSAHLLGRGKPYLVAAVTTSNLALAFVLNYTLIPILGIIGAALSTLAVYLAENVILTSLYCTSGGGTVASLYRITRNDFRVLSEEFQMALRRLTQRGVEEK